MGNSIVQFAGLSARDRESVSILPVAEGDGLEWHICRRNDEDRTIYLLVAAIDAVAPRSNACSAASV